MPRHKSYKFKENVFSNIDTKEKAYWHGLLSADGYFSKNRFGINISVKDEVLLDKFIKFVDAPFYLKKYTIKKKDKWHTKDRIYKYCHIALSSDIFVDNYLKYFNFNTTKKSYRLHLPNVDENFLLSWILGYYDGDGSESSPRISSCSKVLLQQIKDKFSLPFDIWHGKSNVYVLYIGGIFRKQLCDDYPYSLERKRITKVGRKVMVKNNSLDHVDKMMLKSLVITHSLSEIGKMFNVSRISIFSKAKRLGIDIPKRKGGRKHKNYSKVKKNCYAFPCHKNMESCEFCYCPIYHMENCPGTPKYLDNGVKDCSECLFPHQPENYEKIMLILKNLKYNR